MRRLPRGSSIDLDRTRAANPPPEIPITCIPSVQELLQLDIRYSSPQTAHGIPEYHPAPPSFGPASVSRAGNRPTLVLAVKCDGHAGSGKRFGNQSWPCS